MNQLHPQPPSAAFVGASWAALLIGIVTYLIGLWNAQVGMGEKYYFFTLLMYGLFSSVSLQKSLRDRLEGIPVTGIYYGLCWVSLGTCLVLMALGLWNNAMAPSEKGFYIMCYVLSLFAAVAVQKNVRDLQPVEMSAHPAFENPDRSTDRNRDHNTVSLEK